VWLAVVLVLLALAVPTVPGAENRLLNGGFERRGPDWRLSGDAQFDTTVARSGRQSLRVRNGSAQQELVGLPVGGTFTCSAALRCEEVRKTADAGYAYLAIYQLDDFGDLVTARDFAQVNGTAGWQSHRHTFRVAEGCRTVSVRCGLFQAGGTAWFDDFTLLPGDQAVEFVAIAADTEPALKAVGLRPGSKGTVAILKDDLPATTAATSPDHLARVLEEAGFGVVFLDGGQLASPRLLNRDGLDVLVLPYGPSFPVRAAENFRRFLREGGKFFSTGGYAFDDLLERTPQGWRQPTPPRAPDLDHALWRCEVPAAGLRPGGPLTFSGWLKAGHVTGSGMAYFAIYQLAADGRIVEWLDLCKVTGTQDWKEHRHTFTVHPDAATVSLRAGLYRCRGVAVFDDIHVADATGRAVVSADFEAEFDPDATGPGRWTRSSRDLCEVQTRTRHRGQRALKARLDFDLPRPERLNTRHGRPEDGLEVEPTQLGVFQPDYPLERVAGAQAAPDQCLVPDTLRFEGPLSGYAACGVAGFDQARWMPLLNAVDRYGRPRGAVGAMLRHYAGPYAGSSWAFFGVTNRDMFAETEPAATGALVGVIEALVTDCYLAALVPDRGCYRQGETVKLLATVCNGGRQERRLRVRVEICPGEPPDTPVAADASPRPSSPTSQGRDEVSRALTSAATLVAADVSPRPSSPPSRGSSTVSRALTSAATLVAETTIPPGQTNLVVLSWTPRRFTSDFYHVTARLSEGERPVDQIESGFVVWDEQIVAAGPKLEFRDNFLRFGRRPLFLFGTDDWSYVFTTSRETPLQWLRDMRQRRDLGVLIYENLQVGRYFIDLPIHPPATAAQREALSRKVDGVVQLAQRFGQVYFPCLLCGYNVAVSDAELAEHRDFCGAYARRYARVPGLIYYLNGDLRCHLSDAVTPQWNEFLRERYGRATAAGPRREEGNGPRSDERSHGQPHRLGSNKELTARLRDAWGPRAPEQPIGAIPAEDFNDWGHSWDKVKVYDQNLFRAWLIRRWSATLIAAIRAHDPAHPTTAEFYQLPHEGVDIPAGIDGLDLSNFGYFDRPGADLARFPAVCLFNDQRARGKSFGPGEYGVKTHPAWGDGRDYGYHITRTREQALELFLAIPHYTLGLGGSRVHNWCWKDDAHRVFPWGMVYPCDGVPKDTALVHRNQSLLFRHFAPVAREPNVYVLTADTHRMGGGKWTVIEGILKGFDLALGTHVDNLGALNECHLAIPRSARVIFYPLPFCPTDEVYARVLSWVRNGGVLYVSGDLSFDEWRRRTRTPRLEELCGVRFLGENYPNIAVNPTNAADQPCIRVESRGATVRQQTADGAPLVVEHRVGRGRVFFTPDPLELHCTPARRERDVALYRLVLDAAGVRPLGLSPDDPRIHAFRVPLRDGGQVRVLFNTDDDPPTRAVTLTDCRPPLTLSVARRRPALVWFDGRGGLRAVETQGDCVAGETRVVSDATQGILFTLDGQDVRRSRALALMPLRAGEARVQTSARWREPVVETGEFHNAAWRSLDVETLPKPGPELRLQAQPDQVLSVLLVCERAELPRWRKALGQAMGDPASLP
jgi:hypothetical protein